jgi:aspartate/methionine/tyrosine aminotransferase
MASLNPLVQRLSPPPIPAVQAWGRAYGGEGAVIDLSQAVPGYPPHPDLLAWLGEAARSTAYTGYGEIEGEPALRQAYAAHVSELYGAEVGAPTVHITSGCNQAFVAATMAVASAGNTVLLTNPFYFNHETTLAMLGVKVRYVRCPAENSFQPDLAAIEEGLRQGARALALVTPNNPTGAIYSGPLLDRIHDLCRRHGAWLILDETYRDFLPPGDERPHELFATSNWQKSFIQLYSFSKSFCIPGHRLGAITAGEAVVSQVAKIMDNLQICAPRAPQAAVARALPALRDWREANRAEIRDRAAALRKVLAETPGWDLKAIGAYFGFVRHPFGSTPSRVVAEGLAKRAGVVAIPGEYFGEGQEAYLRFAFANAPADTIRQIGPRLERFAL